jgi:adenylate kinase family enzyme
MQILGQRIVVLGISCSGKSTLARELANIYGFQYVELDNLFWKPNWEQSSDAEFIEKIHRALSGSDRWVVDGNYTRVGSTVIWQKADTFVWLDYPLRVNFWRLWKRTWKRFLTQEPMWDAGNKESLWKHFLTRDSLFVWTWQSYPKKKKQYTEMFASPEYADYHRIHLQSPRETDNWLNAIRSEIR